MNKKESTRRVHPMSRSAAKKQGQDPLNLRQRETVCKFHQFVRVERGPVNTALVDLLKGQVYQVENGVIDAFDQGCYEEIAEFMAPAREAELLIEMEKTAWVPVLKEQEDDEDFDVMETEHSIELHVEQGVHLEAVLDKLKYHDIYRVVFYGEDAPRITLRASMVKKEKDMANCTARTRVDGQFEPITEDIYTFNSKNNSCWGEKLAVTADGKVRPCIYSTIVVGDIHADNIDDILEKLETYWKITKASVQKCKDCELKFVCFDCRELAYRQGGDLLSPHAGCKYDPYKGWQE